MSKYNADQPSTSSEPLMRSDCTVQRQATEGSYTPRAGTGEQVRPDRAHMVEELRGTAVVGEVQKQTI